MAVQVRAIESAPFAENSYLLWAPGSPDAVVVDPGFEPDLILDALRAAKVGVAAILNTHGHVDHIAGNRAMKKAFPDAPLVIGAGDAVMLTDADANLSGKWGFAITSPPADRLVSEGDSLEFAGLVFDVLDIPGHSPGHVVYVVRGGGVVAGGDVLFAGGVGRTDFPGGSFPQLAAGIRGKLWPLPDDTKVLPGHGPTTTVGVERRTNPFVGGQA